MLLGVKICWKATYEVEVVYVCKCVKKQATKGRRTSLSCQASGVSGENDEFVEIDGRVPRSICEWNGSRVRMKIEETRTVTGD